MKGPCSHPKIQKLAHSPEIAHNPSPNPWKSQLPQLHLATVFFFFFFFGGGGSLFFFFFFLGGGGGGGGVFPNTFWE